jgi:diaminopimelate epimerase
MEYINEVESRSGLISALPTNEYEPIGYLERVVVAYPSGNTTAVLFDQLSEYDPKELNERIMQAWKTVSPTQPEVEQCCIVTRPRNPAAIARVEMLGGEFCGNATRSALRLLTGSETRMGKVEVSGVDRLLAFSINDNTVTLEMPLTKNSELIRRVNEGWLVQLDGITQLVTAPQSERTPRQLLEELLSSNRYDLATQPAVGVSEYDTATQKARFCVYVRAVNTIFDETACGSGTCAVTVARATENGRTTTLDVIQPSGEVIQTEASYEFGMVTSVSITGGVRVLYDGPLELS